MRQRGGWWGVAIFRIASWQVGSCCVADSTLCGWRVDSYKAAGWQVTCPGGMANFTNATPRATCFMQWRRIRLAACAIRIKQMPCPGCVKGLHRGADDKCNCLCSTRCGMCARFAHRLHMMHMMHAAVRCLHHTYSST
jgi:hypothetical protein